MRWYELTYILPPTVPQSGAEEVSKLLEQMIAQANGKVIKTEGWGKRDLAYPIKKHAEGYYYHLLLEGETALIAELDRRIKLDERIIRHMAVRVEPEEVEANAAARKVRAERHGGRERGDRDRGDRYDRRDDRDDRRDERRKAPAAAEKAPADTGTEAPAPDADSSTSEEV